MERGNESKQLENLQFEVLSLKEEKRLGFEESTRNFFFHIYCGEGRYGEGRSVPLSTLRFLIVRKKLKLMELLLTCSKGISDASDIEECLHLAVIRDNPSMIQLLLDYVVSRDTLERKEVLKYAANRGHKTVASRLLGTYKQEHFGAFDDILHTTAPNGDIHTSSMLKDTRAELCPSYLWLFRAAANGNLEVVKYLLNNGADPSMEDGDSKIALMIAQLNNHHDVVEFLQSVTTVKKA